MIKEGETYKYVPDGSIVEIKSIMIEAFGLIALVQLKFPESKREVLDEVTDLEEYSKNFQELRT